MTGLEAIEVLHTYYRPGAEPGIARVRALLRRMGSPETAFPCVHIVGTNGKGSTAAMLDAVLREAGYSVGLFTSPYLQRFHERIRVDGEEITDRELAETVALTDQQARDLHDQPTEFEVVTCAALAHFRRRGVDIAVLEAGMGGARDATNAIPPPEVAVMTNIGLDHTPFLGGNEVEIAQEKAGVIKPGCHAVLYGQSPQVERAVSALCKNRGVPLAIADGAAVTVLEDTRAGQRISYGPFHGLALPLLGAHQRGNAAVALEAVLALRRRGWAISDTAVRDGLATVRWPGRFEVLSRDPWFIVDGGHNPQCAAAVAQGLGAYFPGEQIVFLLGMMADKDCAALISPIAGLARAFVAVTPAVGRALPAEELAKLLAPYGRPVAVCPDVAEGVALARTLAGPGGTACAMGSLYMTGAVRACFGRAL